VAARRLAEIGSDVYVLDMRGRGLSQRVPYGSHRSGDYANDVLALASELKLYPGRTGRGRARHHRHKYPARRRRAPAAASPCCRASTCGTPSATRSARRACSSCRRDVRTIALRVILCELEEAVALYKVVTQRQLATFTPEQAEAELILTADPRTISTNLSPCTSGAEIGRAIVGKKKPCSGRGLDFGGWRHTYTSPLRTPNHSSGLPLARGVASGV
jgi:hypothetical protein